MVAVAELGREGCQVERRVHARVSGGLLQTGGAGSSRRRDADVALCQPAGHSAPRSRPVRRRPPRAAPRSLVDGLGEPICQQRLLVGADTWPTSHVANTSTARAGAPRRTRGPHRRDHRGRAGRAGRARRSRRPAPRVLGEGSHGRGTQQRPDGPAAAGEIAKRRTRRRPGSPTMSARARSACSTTRSAPGKAIRG